MAETLKVRIEGMSCDHCVRSLESGLKEVAGVVAVKVSLKEGSALLSVSENSPGLRSAISAKVSELGYEAKP